MVKVSEISVRDILDIIELSPKMKILITPGDWMK